jgi:hypothetical protein
LFRKAYQLIGLTQKSLKAQKNDLHPSLCHFLLAQYMLIRLPSTAQRQHANRFPFCQQHVYIAKPDLHSNCNFHANQQTADRYSHCNDDCQPNRYC